MKRLLQWIALVALVGCLASCGLPGAAGRSAGNLFKSLDSLVPSAAVSGTTR